MAQDNHSPVVRSIQSGNDALTVATEDGIVTLTQNDFEDGGTENSGTAVRGIDGKTLLRTPVISGLVAGPGMAVDLAENGVATLASSFDVGTPLDAYSFNHNGTTTTSDGTFLYFTFPKGRQSSMVITMPVSGVPADMQLTARVWACNAGSQASLSVSCYWLPTPAAGTPVSMPSTPQQLGTLSLAGQTGQLSYTETSGSLSFTGNGQLVAVVSTGGALPANDLRLTRIGFILNMPQ
jgi:hypothetical protein